MTYQAKLTDGNATIVARKGATAEEAIQAVKDYYVDEYMSNGPTDVDNHQNGLDMWAEIVDGGLDLPKLEVEEI